jgi:hypothetical protein
MRYFIGGLLLLVLAACTQQPVTEAELSTQTFSWKKLGGALDFTAEKTPYAAQLLLDKTEKPVVASIEDDAKGGRKLVLQRWTGSAWQDFVPTLVVPENDNPLLEFQLDAKNRPIVLVSSGSSVQGNPNIEDGAVYRFESGSWKRLGEPFDISDLVVAPNGNVYALFSNGIRDGVNDKSFIKRWTGRGWQTEYTFQKITTTDYVGNPLAAPIAHGATSLRFTKTNKPVVTWELTGDEWQFAATPLTQVEIWNGSIWTDAGEFWGELILDKKDNLLTASVEAQFSSSPRCGLGVSQGTTGLPELADATKSSSYKLSVDTKNRPVVGYTVRCTNDTDAEDSKQDLVVKRWSGSSWQMLGGVVDRIANRGASALGVAVDSSGTIYVLLEQCFTYSGTTCTNKHLYLSKYKE